VAQSLGWRATHDFTAGLRRTIGWYLAHEPWWRAIRGGTYAGQRLGTVATATAGTEMGKAGAGAKAA
jgi:dTDP-glucose 4,6-dehydratase